MMPKTQLPPGCRSREAIAGDIWAIRKRVLSAWLDPTQLRWSQFWVVECEGDVIACGQLRQFGSVQELGSLVVASAWQGQGVGSALTATLMEQATGPLYLECVGDRLAAFYGRFGFEPVIWERLPPALSRKYRFTRRVGSLLRQTVHVMYYPPSL